MARKPTYEELEQRVKDLKKEIVELKSVENTLRDEDQKKERILNILMEHVIYQDTENNILWANKTACDSAGPSFSELVGRHCYEIWPNRSDPCPDCPVTKAIETGQPQEIEKTTPDGRAWHIMGHPVRNQKGDIVGGVEVTLEISKRKRIEEALQKAHNELEQRVEEPTAELVKANEQLNQEIKERKQAEENLQESKEKYKHLSKEFETILDSLPALLVFYKDKKGNFIRVNKYFADAHNISKEELQGKSTFELYPEQAQAYLDDDLEVIKSRKPKLFIEEFWQTDKVKKWFSSSKIPFQDENGNILGIIGISIDITERKQAEEALKEREKELEMNTGNLEEVNTALRVLLQKRDEDKTKIEENMLSNIKELVEPYLEKLMKSGLDVSQMGYLSVLESNLNDIISPFSSRLSSKYLNLSPAEVQIANLVKQGRSTKEAAELMNLSRTTVATHRRNIRKKLGIDNKKANLRTHLLSIQ